MLPVFTTPLALYGLLALPALAGIYLLRKRYRRQPVSSLLLWLDPHEQREGGPRIDRLQTPLLFFLELLTLALLALAAAGPYVPVSGGGRPLVVVLDDSFSMLAGEPDSPRARALKDLEEELKGRDGSSVRFVLAGEKPALLGDRVQERNDAMLLLKKWRCKSPGASLQEALTLAADVGGELASLLVVTDHPPPQELEKGRVQWRAFGKARPNIAIVTASRTYREGVDRCLIEVANLSDEPGATRLVIDAGDTSKPIVRQLLKLGSTDKDRVHREVFQLKGGDRPILHALIDDDALAIDNEVTLLPAPMPEVRVQVSLTDKTLRNATEKALLATRAVRLVTDNPGLLITDAASPQPEGEAWVLQMQSGREETAFDGPFVMDRAHPLLEGVSLQGVIWAPGTKGELPGTPVVLAGNVPLLTDSEDAAGRHLLRLRMRHDLSTLLESPSWPVLVTTLVGWRASRMPGLNRTNVRLGEEVVLTLTSPSSTVSVREPDGTRRPVSVQEGRALIRAEQTGVYDLFEGEEKTSFAVNALRREESDLRLCETGRWGDWLDDTALKLEYRPIAWMLLLVGLALVVLHLLLVARLRGRTRT
jgi:hypothetical protein